MENITLSSDLEDLQRIVGDDLFLKICKHFEGTSIYFSKNITRDIQKQLIIKDYDNGASYKELAKKYNYSEVWIRELCSNLFKSNDEKNLFIEAQK